MSKWPPNQDQHQAPLSTAASFPPPFLLGSMSDFKLPIAGQRTPVLTCRWKWISKQSTTYHLHIMANRSIGGVFPITQLKSEPPHRFTGGSERPHRAGRGPEERECQFERATRSEDNSSPQFLSSQTQRHFRGLKCQRSRSCTPPLH